MAGVEGIAVGLSTKIMPHNFNEVLEAQIKILKGQDFEIFPDFQQGGLVDVTDYQKGKGKISIPFNNEEELERIMEMFDALKK